MGQHGSPLVRDVENIAVTLLTLFIFKRGIGGLARLFMVVFIHGEMDDDVFDAVGGLCIEKIEGIMGGGQMTVHAIRHKTLGIVHMGRCLPGIIGKLDLVAGGTEFGRGCAHHGVIGNTEYGKGNDEAQGKEENRFPKPLYNPEPQGRCSRVACFGVIHVLPKKMVGFL